MIVEMTGVPGAGKSTVAELLGCQLDCRVWKGTDAFQPLTLRSNPYLRMAGKLIGEMRMAAAATEILLGSRYARHLLASSLVPAIHSRRHPAARINLVRNLLAKVASDNTFRRNHAQLVIVDEGLFHIPQNLYVDTSQVASRITMANILKLLCAAPLPDVLVFVDAPDQILVTRLRERGHARIRPGTGELTHFVTNARIVADATMSAVRVLETSSRMRVIHWRNDRSVPTHQDTVALASAIREIQCTL